MSIVFLSHPMLCLVVIEWWVGAYCMWEKSVGLWCLSQVLSELNAL